MGALVERLVSLAHHSKVTDSVTSLVHKRDLPTAAGIGLLNPEALKFPVKGGGQFDPVFCFTDDAQA